MKHLDKTILKDLWIHQGSVYRRDSENSWEQALSYFVSGSSIETQWQYLARGLRFFPQDLGRYKVSLQTPA